MRLEQLKYLIEVANCKSINKAAQNLYITQPALSIAINSLEEELQYPLLKRTKKGVLLTEDDARVLQEAQMVLNTIQNWYLAKSEQEYELDGVVHIQAIPSICVAMSNTLIFELQKKYPKLSVFLHEKTPQHMVETIANGAVNIGIVSYLQDKEKKLLQKAEQNDLHAEKLAEDERCIMLSAKNPLSQKEILTKEDLSQLTLAYYSDLTDNISEFYRKFFNPERCFRLNSRESILQLVAEDGAAAVFPEKTTRSSYFIKNGLIRPVPAEDLDTKISYYLLYPDLKTMSVNEIRMLDIIREQFSCCLTEGRGCDCDV